MWKAEYPRPQLKRDSFFSLDGQWDFALSSVDAFPPKYERKIEVPFCPESRLSGINEMVKPGEYVFYRRHFSLPEGFVKKRVILHFGAVDQYALVRVNGRNAAAHEGGYEAFSVDITDFLNAENVVEVRAVDPLDDVLPYGKQRAKRGGMWYTPVTGIWQSVWLESVENEYIRKIKITPGLRNAKLEIDGVKSGRVVLESGEEFNIENGAALIEPANVVNWTPENPYLYYFTITTAQDQVNSYFALRTLETKEINGIKRLCLNGKPYFFDGLLDQGYFEEGIYTPQDPEYYEKDILTAKSLGFNTLRKHIKVEPETFYYACDRLGMIVFQDMVNNGKYSFIKDTLLPTLGLQKSAAFGKKNNPAFRKAFVKGIESVVDQLYNHPCICYWSIFNEGWGQFKSEGMYDLLRGMDHTRIIDAASGWFKSKKSDVISIHKYFGKFKMPRQANLPVILSEFGGYVYKIPEHSFNKDKTYGYRFFSDRDSYRMAVAKLYAEQIETARERGLSGCIYTQLSDVEDETNGILTYDREITKLPPGWRKDKR